MIGAWSSTYTLAVMPKLLEYKVPMIVETSSADKITTSGNPYVFRISPTNGTEAKSFTRFVDQLGIKKADFLVVNNDWVWVQPRNSARCSRKRASPSTSR